jgi:predicted nuclease of restriction endonuclease-like (RecB) superfamily
MKRTVRRKGVLVPVTRLAAGTKPLLREIRELIESARRQVAQVVNAGLTVLYWRIGDRIRREILQNERADYGQQILQTLSEELTTAYGRGFSLTNLSQMVRIVEVFPDAQIVGTISKQLSWSHFVEIIQIDDSLKRDFYAEMCRLERWSVRTLRERIDSLLFERTAISRKPEKTIQQELDNLRNEDHLTPDLVFRDPYFLDFLGLADSYSENDVETAILRELERFILELGTDFAFVARQKRITVDHVDYYIDLLFYHRRLRRLVAIDLKLGRFHAADKGQMELYLRWLEAHEARADEGPPLGLILCAEKSAEHVRLLRLDASGIRVAQYLTELPSRRLLARKLHDAVLLARRQLAARGLDPK